MTSPKRELNRIVRASAKKVGITNFVLAQTVESFFQKVNNEKVKLIILDTSIGSRQQVIGIASKIENDYKTPYILLTNNDQFNEIKEVKLAPLASIKISRDELTATRLVQTILNWSSDNKMFPDLLSTDSVKKGANDNAHPVKIIGKADKFIHALNLANQVANTNTTVTIYGETGTGKEVFAKYIHQQSSRYKERIVSVNCAAIPKDLIESQLFGFEKGSFTGANKKHKGKFLQANGGTLFLDEIGELPLNSQAKLLRFLQEKEVEIIGGNSVEKVDARIIVATNRNLREEVAAQNFRSDLFFRLNVFPITLPPLRERKEDIEDLANLFLKKHSNIMGKEVNRIADSTLEQFLNYRWPGNIRELENVIERGVVMANTDTLEMSFNERCKELQV